MTLIVLRDDLNRVGLLGVFEFEELAVADSKKGFLGLYQEDQLSLSSSFISRSHHN